MDRILEVEPGKRVVGIKNVTFNEEFFQGHFPGNPVMPGVLIVEAMAQVAGDRTPRHRSRGTEKKLLYLSAVDRCKFRRPVVPGRPAPDRGGDPDRSRRGSASAARVATVDGTVCARGGARFPYWSDRP